MTQPKLDKKLVSQLKGAKIVSIEYVDIGDGFAPMITLDNGIELVGMRDPEGNGPGFISVSLHMRDIGGL